MASYLDCSCRRPVIQYDPQLICHRLGQPCKICNTNLTHQKCISLCKCYYFCHLMCFISAFQPTIKDQYADYRCKQCSTYLNLDIETIYTYQPINTPKKCVYLGVSISFMVLCIVSLILTLNTPLRTDISFILMYFQGLAIGLAIYFIVLNIRDILYKKTIRIKDIRSTKLQIQTSAFKDIEIQTNQELTKDYLLFQSNKK